MTRHVDIPTLLTNCTNGLLMRVEAGVCRRLAPSTFVLSVAATWGAAGRGGGPASALLTAFHHRLYETQTKKATRRLVCGAIFGLHSCIINGRSILRFPGHGSFERNV